MFEYLFNPPIDAANINRSWGRGATLLKSLNKLDLNLLVVFEAIYSTANISHAAKQLGMSQPAASNALARLRRLMDDPLFLPERRGVTPTAKARRMIGPVRQALGLVKTEFSAGEAIDFASYKRLFRLIIADPFEPVVMPPVLRFITENAPGITIECARSTPTFVDEIRSGAIDLACFAYPVNAPDIVVKPLRSVDPVVIARRGHPGIGERLDRETFCALGHVILVPELRALLLLEQDMAAQEVKRRAVYLVNKVWSIPPIVERTDLIGFAPRWFAEEMAPNFAIEIHEIPVKVADQRLYLLWHVRNENDAGHRWLREAIINAARESDELFAEVARRMRRTAATGPKGSAPGGGRPKIA